MESEQSFTRLSVDAMVVERRNQVSYHHHNQEDGSMYTTHSNTYYATFQVESGDLIEFVVNGREYGMLAEGECGELTFQGTRYIDFLHRWILDFFLWRTGLFCTPIFIKKSLSVRPVHCFLPQSEPSIQRSGDIADECLRSVLRIAA